jgi:nitrate/nitrite-specific signal transduction histidine kinase
MAFLAVFTYLAHFVFSGFLHSGFGFALMLGLGGVAVFVFSHVVFGLMERLERRVFAQNRELAVVSTIAAALSEPLELEQSLQVSLDTAIEVMGASAGVICILDSEREELHSAAHRGLSPAVVEHVRRQKLGDDPIGSEVVRGGRPVVIGNAFDDPRVAELCRREGYRSVISVPMKSQGKVVGVLALASPNAAAFGDARSDLLERVGQQVGIAVEKSMLFREVLQRNRDLTALNRVAAAVSSTLELEEMMTTALCDVMEIAGASSGEVWLGAEDRGCLALATSQPRDLAMAPGHGSVPPGAGLCESVALSGSPAFERSERNGKDGSLRAGIPLKIGGATIGVMCVSFPDRRFILEREKQMLESIAAQLAVAIKNAQLYERVQDMAILEERDRIAREMHDGFAQVLGYVNTKAFAVRRLLSEGKTEEAGELVAQLEEAAQQVYADVREAILGLRATAHNEHGLVPQIIEYLETFARFAGVQANHRVRKGVAELNLPVATEIQLIRIIQEALSNVRKHAQASGVTVEMAHRDGRLRISVADDGRGFDPDRYTRSEWPQFGLQTMHERAEAVGGILRLRSQPGKGTQVTVSVPLNGIGRRRS